MPTKLLFTRNHHLLLAIYWLGLRLLAVMALVAGAACTRSANRIGWFGPFNLPPIGGKSIIVAPTVVVVPTLVPFTPTPIPAPTLPPPTPTALPTVLPPTAPVPQPVARPVVQPPPPGAFWIIAAAAAVQPVHYSGKCPAVLLYFGSLTATKAGMITYRWVDSNEGSSPALLFSVPGPGTYPVPGYMDYEVGPSAEAIHLEVSVPNKISSAPAVYTSSCYAPGPKAAVVQVNNGGPGAPARIVYRGEALLGLAALELYANGQRIDRLELSSQIGPVGRAVDWSPPPGSYRVAAAAVDVQGKRAESPEATLIVQPGGAPVQPQPVAATPFDQKANRPPATNLPPQAARPAPTNAPAPAGPLANPAEPVPLTAALPGRWSSEIGLMVIDPLVCAVGGCTFKGTFHDANGQIRRVVNGKAAQTGVTFDIEPGGAQAGKIVFSGSISPDGRTIVGTWANPDSPSTNRLTWVKI
jgi:hypothetical protein